MAYLMQYRLGRNFADWRSNLVAMSAGLMLWSGMLASIVLR